METPYRLRPPMTPNPGRSSGQGDAAIAMKKARGCRAFAYSGDTVSQYQSDADITAFSKTVNLDLPRDALGVKDRLEIQPCPPLKLL